MTNVNVNACKAAPYGESSEQMRLAPNSHLEKSNDCKSEATICLDNKKCWLGLEMQKQGAFYFICVA